MDDYIDLNRRFTPLPEDSDSERLALESYAASITGERTDKDWSDLLELPRVVILGEPGSGKSRELQERADRIAAAGQPAFCLDLRRLIRESVEDILGRDHAGGFRDWLEGRTLGWFFLDSVDESRLQAPKDFFSGFSSPKTQAPADRSPNSALGPRTPPFGLTLQRSYSSANRADSGPFGPGWTHNFQVTASEDSDGLLGMGEGGTAVDAAVAIVAATVKLDLLQGEKTAERLLIAALIEAWLMDRLTGNVVRIDQPGDGRRFVRLPDGSCNPPPGHADILEANEDGYRLTCRLGRVAGASARDLCAPGRRQRLSDEFGERR